MTLYDVYAAAVPEEPYPTTAALLEKLQEVLEKADVEVDYLLVATKDQHFFKKLAVNAATMLHQKHPAAALLSSMH